MGADGAELTLFYPGHCSSESAQREATLVKKVMATFSERQHGESLYKAQRETQVSETSALEGGLHVEKREDIPSQILRQQCRRHSFYFI